MKLGGTIPFPINGHRLQRDVPYPCLAGLFVDIVSSALSCFTTTPNQTKADVKRIKKS